MFNVKTITDNYQQLQKYIQTQVDILKKDSELGRIPTVRAIVEIPRGCAYKLQYDKGIYWVKRSLENYRKLPSAYGFVENVIGPNGKQIDAIIYIPSYVPSQFINNYEIGFTCVPIMAIVGNTIEMGTKDTETVLYKEYKLVVIPDLYLFEVFKDTEELTQIIYGNIYGLYRNYQNRSSKADKHIFKMQNIFSYSMAKSLLSSFTPEQV